MKVPFKIKFVKLVVPNVTDPSNAINITLTLLDMKKYISSFNEDSSLHEAVSLNPDPTGRNIPAIKPSKNIMKDKKINFKHFLEFILYKTTILG
jgi:hypothetical protein